MVTTTRRLVLEQFGYIDVPIEIDLNKSPDEIYEFARRMETSLDAYKRAFWDIMIEKKQERESANAEKEKVSEKLREEQIMEKVRTVISTEPALVAAKMAEFNNLISAEVAAQLIVKSREQPAQPQVTSAIPAPKIAAKSIIYKSKYGWSLACDNNKQVLDWLLSIPQETRGRKTANPKLSDNGKYVYINDREKDIYMKEAEKQGIGVKVVENES